MEASRGVLLDDECRTAFLPGHTCPLPGAQYQRRYLDAIAPR
jgi:hypothetical protein